MIDITTSGFVGLFLTAIGVALFVIGLYLLWRQRRRQKQVKLWRSDEPEPQVWDVQATEGPEDVKQGGALIIAHYTIVTFGEVTVRSLNNTEQ